MRFTILALIILISISSFAQPATKQDINHALDSFSHTLDTTVVKPPKQTLTNTSITLDTLTIAANSAATFQILVETEGDNTIKMLYIRNIGGVYSIVVDEDIKKFSYNRTGGFFSSTIIYSLSAVVVNNRVVLVGNGQKNKVISWKLSKSTL